MPVTSFYFENSPLAVILPFNLLMKNAEKLNLYHIWLCFSSQHIDLAEDRYVELIREDKEKNEFFSKIKDLDKNK